MTFIIICFSGPHFDHVSLEFKGSLIDIIGAVTYLVCGEQNIQREHFRKIMTSRNVPSKLFQLADSDKGGDLNVKEVMDFLVILSAPV